VKKTKNNIEISADDKLFNAFCKVQKNLFLGIGTAFYIEKELEIVYANIRVWKKFIFVIF